MQGYAQPDGMIGDYCDGTAYKLMSPIILRSFYCSSIYVYYDDIEVCNPIGSKAKKHKLGWCYNIITA